MLSPTWGMVLLHFQVGRSLYVTLIWTLWKWEGFWQILPPFEGEYLEHARTAGQHLPPPRVISLGSHMVAWKYHVYLYNPNVVRRNIGGNDYSVA